MFKTSTGQRFGKENNTHTDTHTQKTQNAASQRNFTKRKPHDRFRKYHDIMLSPFLLPPFCDNLYAFNNKLCSLLAPLRKLIFDKIKMILL